MCYTVSLIQLNQWPANYFHVKLHPETMAVVIADRQNKRTGRTTPCTPSQRSALDGTIAERLLLPDQRALLQEAVRQQQGQKAPQQPLSSPQLKITISPEDACAAEDATITSALAILAGRLDKAILPTLEDPERGSILRTTSHTRTALENYLSLKYAGDNRETLGAIYMDNRNRIITICPLTTGDVSSASLSPNIVARKALTLDKCTSIILWHNHPSGTPEFSRADRYYTEQVKDCMQLIQVRVWDHILVACKQVISMAENGGLP